MASQSPISLFRFIYIVFFSVQNLANSDSLILNDRVEEIRGKCFVSVYMFNIYFFLNIRIQYCIDELLTHYISARFSNKRH